MHARAADAAGTVPAGRRRTTLIILAVAAVASAAGLVAALLSWAPAPADPSRILTVEESDRLAATRVTNYRDVRTGVRVTVGGAGARTDLVGWVDWGRPLIYLDVGGPGAGADRGLLQATPSVVVARPDPAAVPTPAPPPLMPPPDRWRLRELPDGGPLDAALDLLFGLAADRPEPAAALRSGAARWVGRDRAGTTTLDIVQAPLIPTTVPGAARPAGGTGTPVTGTTGPGPAAQETGPGGPPRWWIDRDARLHRFEGRLPGGVPVTVELEHANRPTLRPVPALGGRPGQPRALTDAEAARLDRLATRLRTTGGATVTLTAPAGAAANLRGAGWITFAGRTAYLSVADLDTPTRRTVLRYAGTGLIRAEVPADAGAGGAEAPARPPLPPPIGYAWRPAARGASDLDALVGAALTAGDASGRHGPAIRLRGDLVAGHAVDVIELGGARGRMRYWIDRGGLLRRVELHTRLGAWAQLDLVPGRVPALPPPRPPAPPRPPTPPSRHRAPATR